MQPNCSSNNRRGNTSSLVQVSLVEIKLYHVSSNFFLRNQEHYSQIISWKAPSAATCFVTTALSIFLLGSLTVHYHSLIQLLYAQLFGGELPCLLNHLACKHTKSIHSVKGSAGTDFFCLFVFNPQLRFISLQNKNSLNSKDPFNKPQERPVCPQKHTSSIIN